MRAWWLVFCSISEQFQRFPFLVGFGLVVRLARFPVNPESGRSGLGGWSEQRRERSRPQRCWLDGWYSARSLSNARASSALKALAWWMIFCVALGQFLLQANHKKQ
jgi:hypothetical protein